MHILNFYKTRLRVNNVFYLPVTKTHIRLLCVDRDSAGKNVIGKLNKIPTHPHKH